MEIFYAPLIPTGAAANGPAVLRDHEQWAVLRSYLGPGAGHSAVWDQVRPHRRWYHLPASLCLCLSFLLFLIGNIFFSI